MENGKWKMENGNNIRYEKTTTLLAGDDPADVGSNGGASQ
jgi:hypothetical protein